MTYRYHTGIHVAMNINDIYDIYDKWYIWYTDIHVAMNIKSIN